MILTESRIKVIKNILAKNPSKETMFYTSTVVDLIETIDSLHQHIEHLKTVSNQALDTLAVIRDLFEAGPTRAMINRTIAKIITEVKE